MLPAVPFGRQPGRRSGSISPTRRSCAAWRSGALGLRDERWPPPGGPGDPASRRSGKWTTRRRGARKQRRV